MDRNKDIEAQIAALTSQIADNQADAELLFQRGKLWWRLGRRAEAITDFNSATAIDPASPAKDYLDIVNDILDFYNTDQWNP